MIVQTLYGNAFDGLGIPIMTVLQGFFVYAPVFAEALDVEVSQLECSKAKNSTASLCSRTSISVLQHTPKLQ